MQDYVWSTLSHLKGWVPLYGPKLHEKRKNLNKKRSDIAHIKTIPELIFL